MSITRRNTTAHAMSRVVVDTNVFSSALLLGGLPGTFLDSAFAEACLVVTSAPLLDELEENPACDSMCLCGTL